MERIFPENLHILKKFTFLCLVWLSDSTVIVVHNNDNRMIFARNIHYVLCQELTELINISLYEIW